MVKAVRYSTKIAVVCIGATLFMPSPAFATEREPAPLPTDRADSRLGPWLESHFQLMIDGCYSTTGGLKLLKRGKGDKQKNYVSISSIPKELLNEFGLSTANLGPNITKSEGRDISRYLGYVFPDNDIDDLTFGDDNGYFDPYRNTLGQPITLPGISEASTNYTCNFVAAGKLAANGSYTLPFASVAGALSAESEASSSYALQLLSARFSSPLHLAYNGTDINGIDKFYASLSYLDWYARNPTRIGKLNQFFGNIVGHAIARQYNGRKKRSISAETSAKAGFLSFVDTNASAQAKSGFFTDIRFRDFDLAIERKASGEFNVQKETLPSIAQIMSNLALASFPDSIDDGSRDYIIYDRQAFRTQATLIGVPQNLCAPAYWTPLPPADDVTIRLLGPLIVGSSNQKPTCSFRMELTPSTSYDLRSSRRFPLALELAIPQHADPKVKIPLGEISVSGNTKPQLNWYNTPSKALVPQGAVTRANGTESQLVWNWQLTATDDGGILRDSQIDHSGLEFSCDGEPTPEKRPLLEISSRRETDNQAQINFTMRYLWSGDYPRDAGTTTHKTCRWSGVLLFDLGNTRVPRPVTSSKILVPVEPSS